MIKSNIYKISTAICVLILAAVTVFVFLSWSDVPDRIPIHYNFAGEANGYGGKGSIILLIAISWITFLILTISVKFPDKWNMPVEVTEENKSRLYAITRALLEFMKFVCTILFAVTILASLVEIPMMSSIMVGLIVLILLAVVVAIVMMHKNK